MQGQASRGDLLADLSEARELAKLARRPQVGHHLSALIASLEEQLASLPPADPAQAGAESAAPARSVETAAPEAPETPAAPAARRPAAAPAQRRYEQPSFGWEKGEYGAAWVKVYVSLEGVGAAKDSVQCDFTSSSFDLRVEDLGGKSYRLVKRNLSHDIVAAESKCVVKRNTIIVKLKKVQGEYGTYDSWTELEGKRKERDSSDPSAGIMDMMRDMYNSGDDNMKKVIGEAMMKAKQGGGGGGAGDMDI